LFDKDFKQKLAALGSKEAVASAMAHAARARSRPDSTMTRLLHSLLKKLSRSWTRLPDWEAMRQQLERLSTEIQTGEANEADRLGLDVGNTPCST
jgi:hypothetical protein